MPVVSGSSLHALSPPPPPPPARPAAAAAPPVPPPPPPPPSSSGAWQPLDAHHHHHQQHDCAGRLSLDAWTALWVVLTLAVSLVSVRRLLVARRQRARRQTVVDGKEKQPHPQQPNQPTQTGSPPVCAKDPPLSTHHRLLEQQHQQRLRLHQHEQLRALQQQQGLFWSMAAAAPPCHEAACAAASRSSAPPSPSSSPLARPLPPLPPPPLTPPALAATIFCLDALDGGDAAGPALAPVLAGRDAMDAQLAFMHQPNPDYMSVEVDGPDEDAEENRGPAAPPSAPTATAIASGHRSASGSPRLRNYAKVLPIRGSPSSPPPPPYAWPAAPQQAQQHADVAPHGQEAAPPATAAAPSPSIGVRGEIIAVLDDAGAGWTRHTRVYGGGVCLACQAAEANGGGDGADAGGYGENVPLSERRWRH